MKYNESVAFKERVDTVLSYIVFPSDEIPVLKALCFEDPYGQGNKVGPYDVEVTKLLLRLIQ